MRKLTLRERVLLICLVVIAVVSGYILLFYFPTTQQIESLQKQIAQEEELGLQLEAKLVKQRQMEQSLNQLSQDGSASRTMPEYDNLQAVMTELNSILSNCQEYSLSFQTEQLESNIFCRKVTMPFTCTDYQQALEILQSLHDSPLRSLLTDVQLSQQENGTIKASAVVTFYEYQESVEDDS